MTKITVRTDGGRIKARLQDEAKTPGGSDATGGKPDEASGTPKLVKKAPWVPTVLASLLTPVVEWLLRRLDRRHGRHEAPNNRNRHQ